MVKKSWVIDHQLGDVVELEFVPYENQIVAAAFPGETIWHNQERDALMFEKDMIESEQEALEVFLAETIKAKNNAFLDHQRLVRLDQYLVERLSKLL